MPVSRPFPAILLALMTLIAGCASSEPAPEGFSYDPPGSTVTTDKSIVPPVRRADWLNGSPLGISTAFAGARVIDVAAEGDSVLHVEIAPENAPVNNSPWYAFKIWSDVERDVRLRLTYREGDHRYVPKLSRDGRRWARIDRARFEPDSSTAELYLNVGPDTLWVSGQELITSEDVDAWIDGLARLPFARRSALGESREGRPLYRLDLTGTDDPLGYVLVMGRQHPPEVSGQLGLFAFVEALAADTDLARRFRQRFHTVVAPMANPDGVDGGHWRHNAAGVDLNRDWQAFNQPETRALRDAFLALPTGPDRRVYFAIDFHSTQEDVFYTLDRELPTTPAGFTDAWLARIEAAVPGYRINDEPYGLGSPISKNWFYEQFGAPAVTYEVGDEVDRALVRQVAEASARAMMALLLEEGR